MANTHRNRLHGVRQRLAEARAGALVVTHLPNVFYLCGFSGSAGALIVEAGRATLFTDGRYTVQAREEAPGMHRAITRGPLLAAVGDFLRKRRVRRVGFEPAALSVEQSRELRRTAGPRVRWMPLAGVIETLRAVKDAGEIALMRRAARLGSEVMEEILPLLKPGVSELDIAAEIEYSMRKKGSSGPAFSTIVASGARAALPHAHPTAKKLRKNELVVLDLGAILRGYCCDLTRTVYLGRAPKKIRGWYEAVRKAQQAAMDQLAAGVAAGDVDGAARRVLEGERLERYFVHSTGHGLGIEVHEEPRLARAQTCRIRAGNVVTIEPGVYFPGAGGIRIEDDVAVFANRIEVLTSAPRDFLEL